MSVTLNDFPRSIQPLLRAVRIDFEPQGQPAPWRFVVASLVAIVGSLAADAVIVAIGKAVFPGTKHYAHFVFSDYAKLTVIGVVIACLAWPIVTRISSSPRTLFAWMAVLVTLVLWLPDVYIWHNGQPAKAVGVLMVMHLAIAVVTYCSLVFIAPVRTARTSARHTARR